VRSILTYHSIDNSGSPISVSPEVFQEHVRWLANASIPVMPLSDLVNTPDQESGVAITFDDGFENFGSIAWPLLREFGIPATVFVVSNHVGKVNNWSAPGMPPVPELPLMDWEALGQLAVDGAEIGAHTVNHADLSAISQTQQQAEVEEVAHVIHQKIGQTATSFAYPYGRFNESALELVRARYSLGCTTELRWVTPNDVRPALPRLDMYYFQKPGQLARYGSGRFRRRIQLRRVMRAVRAIGTSVVKR
jgi:peptidoglycan/xylan/chitin deacetylase (PgdA/CDA1 family)